MDQKDEEGRKHVHFDKELAHPVVYEVSVVQEHETEVRILRDLVDVGLEGVLRDAIVEFHHLGRDPRVEESLGFHSRKQVFQ